MRRVLQIARSLIAHATRFVTRKLFARAGGRELDLLLADLSACALNRALPAGSGPAPRRLDALLESLAEVQRLVDEESVVLCITSRHRGPPNTIDAAGWGAFAICSFKQAREIDRFFPLALKIVLSPDCALFALAYPQTAFQPLCPPPYRRTQHV